ncbi:hypothetical protein D3C72_1726730 [compost metagenome]
MGLPEVWARPRSKSPSKTWLTGAPFSPIRFAASRRDQPRASLNILILSWKSLYSSTLLPPFRYVSQIQRISARQLMAEPKCFQ